MEHTQSEPSAFTHSQAQPEPKRVAAAFPNCSLKAVVANGAADVLGHSGQVADKVFNALGGQTGVALQGRVDLAHVGRVVLAVMDFHGARVDMRFQRVECVRQCR